jgi:uncharacterized protein
MDIDAIYILLLLLAGVAAGFVNTIAGGGSIFTLPVLMLMGLPADVANGTNRVGVLIQSLAGVRGFNKHKMLDHDGIMPILVPTMAGGLIGSFVASIIPVDVLKPVLLGTMMAMTLFIVLKPGTIPEVGEKALSIKDKPIAWLWVFLAGLYGGFIQAGVGFIMIAAFAGVLRYDLNRANAMKMVCTLLLTVVALVVFVIQGQVQWLPGVILGVGSVVGVQLSVRFAISAKQKTLKWILLGMAMAVCLAALIK